MPRHNWFNTLDRSLGGIARGYGEAWKEDRRDKRDIADDARRLEATRTLRSEDRAATLEDASKLAKIQKDAQLEMEAARQAREREAAFKLKYDEGRQAFNALVSDLKQNAPHRLKEYSDLIGQVEKGQVLPQNAVPHLQRGVTSEAALRQKQAEKEQLNADDEKKAAAKYRTGALLLRQLKEPAIDSMLDAIDADPNSTAASKAEAVSTILDTRQKMATYKKTVNPPAKEATPRDPNLDLQTQLNIRNTARQIALTEAKGALTDLEWDMLTPTQMEGIMRQVAMRTQELINSGAVQTPAQEEYVPGGDAVAEPAQNAPQGAALTPATDEEVVAAFAAAGGDVTKARAILLSQGKTD